MTVSTHKASLKPIELTPVALQHVKNYLIKNNARGFRVYLKKTGCSGYSYAFDYVNEPQDTDLVFKLDNDHNIFVEKSSYPLLQGSHIDYVKQGFNYKLIFANPNQTGQCGCGESFTVEDQS